MLHANEHLDKLSDLSDSCPTCEQTIHADVHQRIKDGYNLLKTSSIKNTKEVEAEIETARQENDKVRARDRYQNEFEEAVRRWDSSLPSQILDGENISQEIDELSSKISNLSAEIQRISSENMKAERHNTRLEIIQEQTENMENELEEIVAALGKVEERATYLEILKKAFSTNGLLAYKISKV